MRHTRGMVAELGRHESESWLDAGSPQRYGQYLARRMLAGAAVIVIGSVLLAQLLGSRLETAERDEDLAFTAALSLAPDVHLGPLATASGREALVWRVGEAPQVFRPDDTIRNSSAFSTWRLRIRDQALASAEGRYLSIDSETGWAASTPAAGPRSARWQVIPEGAATGELDGRTVTFQNSSSRRLLDVDAEGRVRDAIAPVDGARWELQRLRGDIFAITHADLRQRLAATGPDQNYSIGLTTDETRATEWEIVRRRDGSYELLNAFRASREDRQFDTVDPEGEVWWHTTVRTLDGSTLVTSRSEVDALTDVRSLTTAIALIAGLLLLAVATVWALLHRRLAEPLQRLATAGEDLRVRGEMRPEVRVSLGELASGPSELRELAQALERIEDETIRGQQQARSLLAAASALGASLESATVLDRTLEQLHRLIGVERSVIIAYDAHHTTRDVIASRGHNEEFHHDLRDDLIDPTLPSRRALRERSPVQVGDTLSDLVSSTMRARSIRHSYRSVLAIPLAEDLERPTVLMLHSDAPRTFSFDEIELAKSFASIAGAAIRNAELFSRTDADLRRQTSRLDAIVESVDQGILVEASDGRLLFANARMRALAAHHDVEPGKTSTDLIAAIAARTSDPARLGHELAALYEEPESWVDVEVTDHGSFDASDSQRRGRLYAWRVRGFDVVDSRGISIGRGLVWSDITRDRDLEHMKHGLLATVSHEFRTPLALIKGYATTLLADDVEWDPEEQKEFLTLVNAEADRLTSLVRRLLDMRRIDAGMVTLQRLPTEVSVMVDSTLDAMPHQRRRIRVGDLPEISVSVDAARVVTVLRNLLENACTYSGEELVDMTVELEGDVLRTSVRDRGPGIAPDMRARIFDTFVRGDSSLDAEYGGIGLGLAIARGFVEAHGGRIEMRDPADGGPGVVFSFTLPLAPAAEPTITDPGTGSTIRKAPASEPIPREPAALEITSLDTP